MKRFGEGRIIFHFFYGFAAMLILAASCSKEKGDCTIALSFSQEYAACVQQLKTKGEEPSLPDTNDFILSITGEDGSSVYSGKYGNRPEEIAVSEGIYSIVVLSREFSGSAFSAPQFGDSLSIEIASGETVPVSFHCTQMNVGMKISYSEEFMNRFPSSVITLTGGGGTLEYSYTEERIAYFFPGKVEMRMATGGTDRHILSRTLARSEIMTINMSVGSEEMAEADFRLEIDTSRIWITENFEYGKENDGSTRSKSLTVPQAIERAGEEEVWIRGFIVGGDATSASFKTTGPFSSDTHFIIAEKTDVSERGKCMAVELKSGAVRDSLNLVSYPQLFHKEVFVKGNIVESYFGLYGIKGIKEFYK